MTKRKILSLLIGLFLIVGTVIAQGIARDENEPLGYINYLEGSGGRILSQDFLGEAEVNMPILQGDELRTQYCRIEICLIEAGYIRLDYNTIIDFTVLKEKSTMLKIWRGNVYIRAEDRIVIETFDKSFNLEPGLYRIEVTDKTKVYKNPMYEDDFDKWNYWREKEVNHPNTYLYKIHIDSLYSYGSWQWNPVYGWIWVPLRSYWGLRYSYWPWSFSYGRWYRSAAWGWYWIPKRTYYHRYRNAQTVIHKNQLRQRGNATNRTVSKSTVSKSRIKKSSVTSAGSPVKTITQEAYSPRKSISQNLYQKSPSQSSRISSRSVTRRVFSNPRISSSFSRKSPTRYQIRQPVTKITRKQVNKKK